MKQIEALGFIGFGEVAFNMSQGFIDDGIKTIYAFDKFAFEASDAGELIRKRAKQAGVTLVSSSEELAKKCQVIFSTVVAKVAVLIAKQMVPHLTANHLFIDANSASPELKKEISEVIGQSDALFSDCAIMAAIRKFRNRVPILADGNGAETFKLWLSPYGMEITDLGTNVGKASAVKMLRSVFTKGYVGLMFEMLVAADKYDAVDMILDLFSATWDKNSFKESVDIYMTGGVIHALRRGNEMTEVIKTLDSMGFSSEMSEAAQKKLRWAHELGIKEHFKGEMPENTREVLDAFKLLIEQQKEMK